MSANFKSILTQMDKACDEPRLERFIRRGNYSYSYEILIKTHDSESRGQEEAGRTQQMSELFTRSTAVKLVNALPLKLLLSYQGFSTF